MPLPEDFNEWEHLQNTIRYAHNKAVRDFFSGQADNDIDSIKGSAKHACLMKDNDTTAMTTLRMWLFWVVCRKMRDNFEPYLGVRIPAEEHEVKYKPQVTCFFLEDQEDVEYGYRPVEGQLSVRLIEETSKTLTKANLETIANRINAQFGQGNGYVWQKGKNLYSYVDKPLGHRHKVLAKNQADAVAIIQKLLAITQDPFKSSLVRLNAAEDPNTAFPSHAGGQQRGDQHTKGGLIPPVHHVPNLKQWEVDLDPIYMPHNKGVRGNFYRILPYVVKTSKGTERGDFGVHLDANAPGSLGCPVMNQHNWSDFEKTIKQIKAAKNVSRIPLFPLYS